MDVVVGTLRHGHQGEEPFAMDIKVRNPLPWTSYDVRRTEEGLVYRFASVCFLIKPRLLFQGIAMR